MFPISTLEKNQKFWAYGLKIIKTVHLNPKVLNINSCIANPVSNLLNPKISFRKCILDKGTIFILGLADLEPFRAQYLFLTSEIKALKEFDRAGFMIFLFF